MKLARFQLCGGEAEGGAARIGVVGDGDRVWDLTAAALATSSMSEFLSTFEERRPTIEAAIRAGSAPELALRRVVLLPPVGDPPKILCIGQNYRDHCEEQNQPIPDRAILFSKYSTALNRPGGDVPLLPGESDQVDFEAELAVVLGKAGRSIPEERAMEHVAGYLCANDVTARDIQFGDKQWVRGKSPDLFFPIGPWLVTKDEVPDPHALDISLTLNGETMQHSNTRNLIFRIPFLISYLSRTMTLLPGDLLSTGTPGGVGVFRKPPRFLQAGDEMAVTISGLGSLKNRVVAGIGES